MAETPREPDRFDKQGEELACAYHTVRCPDRATLARQIAAALRAEAADALNRLAAELAQVKNGNIQAGPNRKTHVGLIHGIEIAEAIVHRHVLAARALASPVAAPAAETKVCVCRYLGGAEFMGKCPAHPAPPSEPAAPSLFDALDAMCDDRDALHERAPRDSANELMRAVRALIRERRKAARGEARK